MQKTPKLSQEVYGKGQVVGWPSRDMICPAPKRTCHINEQEGEKGLKFINTIYTQDLEGFQGTGMIGLSPTVQNSDAQLFVDAHGHKEFSINLGENKAFFGDTNRDPEIPAFGMHFHECELDAKKDFSPYWIVPLRSVKYGTTGVSIGS